MTAVVITHNFTPGSRSGKLRRMAKTGAQLDREIAAALIAGDAELEGRFDIGKKIRKQEGARGGALIGYTTSKKPVYAPARDQAPRIGSGLRESVMKNARKFPKWTWQDHEDAARLHKEAAGLASASGNSKLANALDFASFMHDEVRESLAEKQLVAELKKAFRNAAKPTKGLKEFGDFGATRHWRSMSKADAEHLFDHVIRKLGMNGKGYGVQGDNEELEVWNHNSRRNSPTARIILDTGEVRG